MKLGHYFKVLKPTKTIYLLFVLLGLYWGGGLVLENTFNILSLLVAYWFLYGALYAINDIVDYENDRKDYIKSKRIIASGKLTRLQAGIFATTLVLLFSYAFYLLDPNLLYIVGILIFVNLTYVLIFKKIAYVGQLYLTISSPFKIAIGLVYAGGWESVTNYALSLLAFYIFIAGIGMYKVIKELDYGQERLTVIGKYTYNGLYIMQGASIFPLLGLLTIAHGPEKTFVWFLCLTYFLSIILYYHPKYNIKDRLQRFATIMSQGFPFDFKQHASKVSEAVEEAFEQINKTINTISENGKLTLKK